MRTIPIGKSITPQIPVAHFDRIEQLIASAAPPFAVLPCICREKKAIQGEPCTRTGRKETCMAMGNVAHTVIEMGIGREISRAEATRIIQTNQKEGLVLQPSNTRNIDFLCSCCGCCCSMLGLQKDLPVPLDFWTANFRVRLDASRCLGCGKCVKHCQAGALEPTSGPEKKTAPRLNPRRCIGCGVCVPVCPANALALEAKPAVQTPPRTRDDLSRILLKDRKNPLAPVKTIGKLARGIMQTRDLRLLRKSK